MHCTAINWRIDFGTNCGFRFHSGPNLERNSSSFGNFWNANLEFSECGLKISFRPITIWVCFHRWLKISNKELSSLQSGNCRKLVPKITFVVLRSDFFGTRSVPFHKIRNEFRVFRSVPGKIRNEFRFVPVYVGTSSGTPERGTRSSTTLKITT